MTSKVFEVLDRGTCIPVLCTLVVPTDEHNAQEQFLLRRCGYSRDVKLVLMTKLAGGASAQYDPHGWSGNRTYFNAHKYITDHWEDLPSGAVVDVEHILGETKHPRPSENLEPWRA